MNLETAFTDHAVFYDPADQANNGLYVCLPENHAGALAPAVIASLTAMGLWTAGVEKTVKTEQKADYLAQLDCHEVVGITVNGMQVWLCATDHPRFPMDRARWNAWKTLLAAD